MTTEHKKGVTLVELLTVVAVLAILFALLIPQVRFLTKDRSIRESARIFGSAVVEASQKARVDGFAGIEIVRNPNVSRAVDGGEVFYACYEMFQLRQPRSYVGNSFGETADVSVVAISPQNNSRPLTQIRGIIQITVPEPFDTNIDISRGFVRLNHSKATYPIVGTSTGQPGAISLLCQIPRNYEIPAEGSLPFEVIRTPVRRQSSRVEVPRGYVVNLNYSGPIDNGTALGQSDSSDLTWTAFSLNSPAPQESAFIIFDDNGGIDRIYPNGFGQESFRPNGSVHFCIAPDEQKHGFAVGADLSDDMLDNEPSDVLDEGALMWVTLNHLNGSVVVAENAVPITTYSDVSDNATVAVEKRQRLREALAISGERVSARQ